jgi:hypothetical protein
MPRRPRVASRALPITLAGALLATTFAGTCARRASAEPRERVTVHVEAGATVDLYQDDDRAPYASCIADCALSLPRGRYRVHVGGLGVPETDGPVDVYGTRRIDAYSGSSTMVGGGKALWITGTVVGAISLVGLAISNECTNPETGCSSGNASRNWSIALGVSVVAVLGGLLLDAAGRSTIDVTTPQPAPKPAVGFAPMRGGGLLSAGFAF